MPTEEKQPVAPLVSDDAKQPADETKDGNNDGKEAADNKDAKKSTKTEKEKADEMSEEDKTLKATLDTLVSVVIEPADTLNHTPLQATAMAALTKEIRSSTASMTSIPKPLKFLKPHWTALLAYYEAMDAADPNKAALADILSVLSMTQQSTAQRLTLKFKMAGAKDESIGVWGHEYVRHLAGEIGKERNARLEDDTLSSPSMTDLDKLVDEIIPFFMEHNAEFDAVDLLVEVEALNKLESFLKADKHQMYRRVCLYVVRCAEYIIDSDEHKAFFNVAFNVYLSHHDYADAIRVAIRLRDEARMTEALTAAEQYDMAVAKQCALILGEHRIILPSYAEHSELADLIGNVHLSSMYHQLATDLDVREAKTPEDIYKTHLEDGGVARRSVPRAPATATTSVDSAKQNLASMFVNAFVNAGFCKDALITPEGGTSWLFKNKAHGMISATASLGLIMLWDVESGFSAVDGYSFTSEAQIKAGTALAHGILSSGIASEMDAAQALLAEHVESKDVDMKLSAVLGLGLAYCGTARADVTELLIPLIVDDSQSMEVIAHACLALGLVYCGTASDEISGPMIDAFMDRSETDLKDSVARLMCVGMGLLFLNRGSDVEPALSALAVINHPISAYLTMTVQTCAYVGVSSPLEIQKFLSVLTTPYTEEVLDKEPFKGMEQEAAVLGIAMVAMGEELSSEMALRALDAVLQYCQVNVRRIIPLALGLLSISNPRLTVMDTLSKLSHDSDQIVSQTAVLAMGLCGAGTNNSRLAGALRQLATYYTKEPNHLFLVRIAQGLLHMGKGLLTLSPLHSDGFTLSSSAMAGLITLLHTACDLKNTILSKRHYLLFSLVTAMRPRWLVTVDADLKPVTVTVKLGQRVDTVGQAGKPKGITGFQTHKTPVLIGAGERAEMASEEWLPMTAVLEGVVILKKNPDYQGTTTTPAATSSK